MNTAQQWQNFFTHWPASFARKGVVITNLNEPIPFKDYWLRNDMLLLERNSPDAGGGRFLLLDFGTINMLKFTQQFNPAEIEEAGFMGDINDTYLDF